MMVNKEIYGQPSFVLENELVSLAVTKLGGHMAPVVFGAANDRQICPYYISPGKMKTMRTCRPKSLFR